MKAISIHAPWAYEIAAGVKSEEYRSWKPKNMPKELLICSSAKKYPGYVCGYALGVAEIEGVEEFEEDGKTMYAWQISKCWMIEPFPVKGKQKMFEVDDKLIKAPKAKNYKEWHEKKYDPLRSW